MAVVVQFPKKGFWLYRGMAELVSWGSRGLPGRLQTPKPVTNTLTEVGIMESLVV